MHCKRRALTIPVLISLILPRIVTPGRRCSVAWRSFLEGWQPAGWGDTERRAREETKITTLLATYVCSNGVRDGAD